MPWDFWDMTPAEVQMRVEAFQRAQEREWRRSAWMVMHIMSASLGDKAPDVDELLGHKVDAMKAKE